MDKQLLKSYDVLRDCSLLEKDKSFENLYKLICAHGEIYAAMWMEGNARKFLTFNQQKQLADNYAAVLSRIFGKEGRVCISLDACKEWFPIFWGLVRSGHDVLAIDPSMSDEKAENMMKQTNCTMLIAGRRRNLGPEYKQVVASDLANSPVVKDYKPVWGKNVSLCTSGTTSESRIFVYNEDTICYLALFSAKVFKENHRLIDNQPFRTLAFLPFHHVLGFAGLFIWSHFLGYTTVYLKDRTPQTIMNTSRRCKVSQIVTVPLLANNITKSLLLSVKNENFLARAAFYMGVNISLGLQSIDPKAGLRFATTFFRNVRKQILGDRIKSLVLGGGHTDPKSLRILNAIGYYSLCGYGMTETAINSFETSYRLDNRLRGSVGTPMAYTEFRIKGGGNFGELQIRGKGIHDGRFVDGKLLPPDVDADGWFSTGDLMRINKGAGLYFIEGRIKDVIINESGENVSPDELEDTFAGIEGVEQFTIMGLPKKSRSIYEDISFVASVGASIDNQEVLSRIASEVASRNDTLPVIKRLSRAVVTSAALPMTNTLKVKRQELKKAISSGTLAVKDIDIKHNAAPVVSSAADRAQESEDDKIRRKIRKIYSETLNIPEDQISDTANFIDDLGGDSLQVLSITSRAEEEFGVFIPADSYIRCATVAGADQLIHELVFGESSSNKLVERDPITSFEQTPEYAEFKKRRESLIEEGGSDPYFVCHDSPLLDTSVINGREVLDFGSYNYVGMSGRKEVNEAAAEAINKYGTSASGSRLLAGEKPVHGELERELAEWKNSESALVLVGGHSTNVTVVGNFCGKNDLIIYDALAHNSVTQGCKLSDAMSKSFPHNDIEALEKILKAQRKYFEKVLIVIEGVYSMDGDVSDIPAFVALKKKYGCFLMVDEAHSSCVLGETGGGVDEYFHLAPDDIDIKYGTLSKGLGTCGGYVAGRKCLIDYFRYNLPGFVFSVGISPGLAAGSLKAIRLLRNEPSIMKRLHDNIDFFASEAKKRHLNIGLAGKSAILPVLIGKDEDAVALSNELLVRGISVPPALYPAVPKNKARLRFDVISEHKPEQITYALDTLLAAASDLGITITDIE